MNILDTLKIKCKARLMAESFFPTWVSVILNPIFIVRSSLLKGIITFAPKIEGNVLDFGCGSKPYEKLFKNIKNYVGIDVEVSGHNHENSKVDYYYNGKTLPFPDNSFDCVVCFEVFEHVFNVDEVCAEISRVLKPNGLFLMTLPFVWEEHEIPYDFARYSSYGIKHILTVYNFKVIKLVKSATYVLTVGQLVINYLSQNISPHNRFFGLIFRLIVIFPLNIIFLFADWIFPKSYSLYCNNIVLSQNLKLSK